MEYKIGKKIGGTKEEIEKNLDEQNSQAVKRFTGMFKPSPSGTSIPQEGMANMKPELKPYNTEYAGRGAGDSRDLAAGSDVMRKIDEAEKANMMKQLEDLDQVGAFEEPDSDVNVRAAKLRALLGK
jgi:hypothetical protein